MSNVVTFRLPAKASQPQRQALLLDSFATHRRGPDDVYWLKENAEVLNVLESTGAQLAQGALEPYRGVYEGIRERIRFFPQYYRFLLSICLDLEDLGMPGQTGAALCDWAAQLGLAQAELSDLQRAEAERLLARRGCATPDPALEARLRAFISRSDTFALPNKKAAYELTHIVFYLSEYGRHDPKLCPDSIRSLQFAGLLAYLDQNADLLAEVCVALRFAGQTPSVIWEDWLRDCLSGFMLTDAPEYGLNDAYHEYLVTSWWAEFADAPAFPGDFAPGLIGFQRQNLLPGPLRAMSETMFSLGAARSGDWMRMRPHVADALEEQAHGILSAAEQSSELFDAFFEGFARAGQ